MARATANTVHRVVNPEELMTDATKCPFPSRQSKSKTNSDWWSNQLDIQVLHRNSTLSDPMGEAFDYAKEFKTLDLNLDPILF